MLKIFHRQYKAASLFSRIPQRTFFLGSKKEMEEEKKNPAP
jgi:hypothetical protein